MIRRIPRSVWCLPPVFVLLTIWSWRRWPDMLVDIGHQLYIPWRLAEGEVLYRDISYIMGPLSQEANAVLFRLFGESMSTLIWCNLLILCAISTLLWRLLRIWSTANCASLLTVLFLCVFAFSQYVGVASYNFVLPYRHEMTHGLLILLVLAHVLAADPHSPRLPRWLSAGFLCGLLFLLKAELTLAGVGFAAVFWWLGLLSREGREWQAWLKALLVYSLAFLVPTVVAVAWYCRWQPPLDALRAVLTTWELTLFPSEAVDGTFYLKLMGLDRPLELGAEIARAALVWALALSVAVAIGLATAKFVPRRHGRRIALVVAVIVGYLAIPHGWWYSVGRPLPFLAAGLALWHCRRWWRLRHTPAARKAAILTAWAALAAAILLKVSLRARIGHYGFVLAVPAAVLVWYELVHELPLRMRRFRAVCEVRNAMIGLLLVFCFQHLAFTHEFYTTKTMSVGRGQDTFFHDPQASPRHFLLPKVLDYLRDSMSPGETLLVAPEGISFNYFLRARHTIPYYQLNPWEMVLTGGEQAVIDSLEADSPDWIVLLKIDMKEYGYRYLGLDYGLDLVTWVRKHYDVAEVLTTRNKAETLGFDAVVMRRKP
ncbi:MAG TPA: hypothetical protein DCR55_13950 [Lentisphaeria bacterium]|nr:hypothetical protein [Lentisphaeria bacterium]